MQTIHRELESIVDYSVDSISSGVKKETIYVVGNRFTVFAENEGVYTVDNFFKFAYSISKNKFDNTIYQVVLGQGLSEYSLLQLKAFFISDEFSDHFYLSTSLLFYKKADEWMTHKHQRKNILISAPNKLSENCYESILICDDQCDEMQDHLTGEHLQAMLLVEASRQMMTATAELHWINKDLRGKKNFVLDSFSSQFLQYVFPLEVTFQLTVKSFRAGLNGNFKADVNINVMQLGQVMMSFQGAFSAMEKDSLAQLESMLAKRSLENASNTFEITKKVA